MRLAGPLLRCLLGCATVACLSRCCIGGAFCGPALSCGLRNPLASSFAESALFCCRSNTRRPVAGFCRFQPIRYVAGPPRFFSRQALDDEDRLFNSLSLQAQCSEYLTIT